MALLAMAVVALLVALAVMIASGASQGPGIGTAGPTAMLDAAIAGGTPAYVLIHSDT